MSYRIIAEPPPRNASITEWEAHRRELDVFPQDDEGVQFAIRWADRTIAVKREEEAESAD